LEAINCLLARDLLRLLKCHDLHEFVVVRIEKTLAEVLVCLQDVASETVVLVLTGYEKDVLKGLWREHLVVQQ
jgi:hypothetical protein